VFNGRWCVYYSYCAVIFVAITLFVLMYFVQEVFVSEMKSAMDAALCN